MDDEIRQVMASVFRVPVEMISSSTTPDTLPEWSSLRHVQLVSELEKYFQVAISEPESIRLMSFGRIRELILKKRS